MSSNPLSYDSLKCVLRYMEANKRLLVSNKYPAIRTTEKVVPLRLNFLNFLSNGDIVLNNTTYRIGIYQHYYKGQASAKIKFWNEMGGVQYEVDWFGIRDPHDECIVRPGDVVMKRKEVREEEKTDVEIIRTLKDRIRNAERKSHETFFPWKWNSVSGFDIDKDRDALSAYQYRRANSIPPYEHFIQVTVDPGYKKPTYIERYGHDKKYSEAMKQLAVFLFGGRRHPIYSKHCSVGDTNIIRLPVGVQFEFGEIELPNEVGTRLEALKSIIHESSLPLKSLIVSRIEVADMTYPMVRDAESLTISDLYASSTRILPLLLIASNRRLTLNYADGCISSGEVLELTENWLQKGRPVGTYFCINFSKKRSLKARVEMLRNRLNGATSDDDGKVIAPMVGNKQLKVFYDKYQNRPILYLNWSMHMIVEAV